MNIIYFYVHFWFYVSFGYGRRITFTDGIHCNCALMAELSVGKMCETMTCAHTTQQQQHKKEKKQKINLINLFGEVSRLDARDDGDAFWGGPRMDILHRILFHDSAIK